MEQSCITVSIDNSLNEDGYICQICSPFKYEPNENKFYQHLIMSHFKEKLLIRYGILVKKLDGAVVRRLLFPEGQIHLLNPSTGYLMAK